MKRNLAARLGGWSARHRKTAILGWLAFVVLATVIGGMAGQRGLQGYETGTGDSARAEQIVAEAHLNSPAGEMVLVQGQTTAIVKDLQARLWATRLVGDMQPVATSANGRDALVQFRMTGDPDTAADRVQPLLDAVTAAQAAHPAAKISEVGDASGEKWFNNAIGHDFARAEWSALPLALGILLVTFGALLAAVLPVGLALTAFLASLGLLNLISQAVHMDGSANSVMLLIGLAVGVDYCLFYLRREREERAAGHSAERALEIAAATSGRSVLVSGLTVMVAMAGMFLSGLHIFEGFAIATILVVLVAMLGSVTVLPALLSALGDKIEWGRPRRRRRSAAARRPQGRVRGAVLRPVLARPLVFTIVSAGFLLALAAPVLGMHTEKLAMDKQLPPSNSLVRTLDAINKDFPGAPAPARVVLKADAPEPAVRTAVAAFTAATPGAHVAMTGNGVTVVDVPLPGSGTDATSRAALTKLRTQTVPQTLGRVGEAKVAGDLAQSLDFNGRLTSSTFPVLAFVMGITFLVMLVSFRSLTVALTAIVLNMLSVAAAFGVMVAMFQHGWGIGLVGGTASGALESWIPLFVFVVLFGLSMDYHVFVVSRIREARERGLATRDAVGHGIRSTAGAVTSAAVIMVAVFSVFGTLSMQDFKQLGVGLAVAVLLDATIVRAVLLPALMSLLGERNWYLPRALSWLPRVSHAEQLPAPHPHPTRVPA